MDNNLYPVLAMLRVWEQQENQDTHVALCLV